jgi:hypothetical protein
MGKLHCVPSLQQFNRSDKPIPVKTKKLFLEQGLYQLTSNKGKGEEDGNYSWNKYSMGWELTLKNV